MCWISQFEPKLQTAQNDIFCFKILDKTLNSLYAGFKYELRKEYQVPIGKPCVKHNLGSFSTGYIIGKGFHSYTYDVKLKTSGFIKKGQFTLVKYKQYILDRIVTDIMVAVRCYIPRGSQYYINEYGELVSNKIVITSIL